MGMFQSAFNSLLTSTGAAIDLGTKLAEAPAIEAEKEQKKAEHARTQERIETRFQAWQARQTPPEPDPAVIEQRAKELAHQNMLANMKKANEVRDIRSKISKETGIFQHLPVYYNRM